MLCLLAAAGFAWLGYSQVNTLKFDIPEGQAKTTLRAAARQADVDIVFTVNTTEGLKTRAIRGKYTIREALDRMLEGTTLEAVQDSLGGAYAIVCRVPDGSVNQDRRPEELNVKLETERQTEMQSTEEGYINSKSGKNGFLPRMMKVLAAVAAAGASHAEAQQAGTADENEELFELSPFTVEGSSDQGYRATSTLAGTRFRTDLVDIGSSISVLTDEFLQDVGAVDNETVLAYATNTEVGGPRGNFSGGVSGGSVAREQGLFGNPNNNTRVRGLSSADNTRNYFSTDIPWDGYVVNRVDLLRGPNSILFGLGSPSGVVNATTTNANLAENGGEVSIVVDQFGSLRGSVDYNKVLIEDELSIYVAALRDDQKFRQSPAFELDERYYVALKYKPSFLNSDSSNFEVTGNYEKGDIESNRPRTLTPGDQITPFWNPITPRADGGEGDHIPYTAANYPGQPGGVGKMTFNHLSDPEQYLDSNEGNNFTGATGALFMGGPMFHAYSNDAITVMRGSVDPFGARLSDGTIADDSTGGVFVYGDNFREQILASATFWATNTGQYGSGGGFWENQTLSDPTIFDFYNNLLDGPNKKEWTDWTTYEASVSHTFLGGKLGYNLAIFDQKLDRGQYGILGWENRIFIDINEQRSDGTPNQADPDTANPNIGRPFISELLHSSGTGARTSDRTAYRAQLFAEHDFADNADNLLTRILGRHRLTGLRSQETRFGENRSINLAMMDPAYYERFGGDSAGVGVRAYLGGDLRGMSSPSGAQLSRIQNMILPSSGPITMRAFDTTWNAPSVDPAAVWEDPDDLRSEAFDTQATNPANYIGWTDVSANVISFLDEGTVAGMSHKDYLTNDANLSDDEINSNVFVWQGHFFNDAIVGLYGYREDESKSVRLEAADRAWPEPRGIDIGHPDMADVRPSAFNLSNPINPQDLQEDTLDTETTNWSVAVHLNKLLGDRDVLPLNVSLYYNEGENAQPGAGRLDAFARPLPPPQGTTEEYSLLLATKNGKYSLRATDYKTVVTNQNTTGDIGAMWALQQTIFSTAWSNARFLTGSWNTADHPNEEYLVDTIIPAWQQFERDLQEEFPLFIDAWVRGPWAPPVLFETNASRPSGHVFTEDAISEGQEFEFMANPIENWRIAINASRTEAIRDNVPGQTFLDVSQFVDNAIMNTPAGEMPVWWSASPGVRFNIYPTYRGDYLKLLALNGQLQPEVREWRANLITNYSFLDGRLKGFGVGGAVRWEDKAAIDYLPSDEDDNLPNIADPVLDDGYESFDLWASYQRPINDNIDWRIQLNVYNAFGSNEVVPLSTDPFGNPNRFRIREGASWRLSNTFSF